MVDMYVLLENEFQNVVILGGQHFKTNNLTSQKDGGISQCVKHDISCQIMSLTV